jgi:hypothetical protein
MSEIKIRVRMHCSVTETDHGDFVSWTSDFLSPPRASRLYTTKTALLVAIEAERAAILAMARAIAPTFGDIALTLVSTHSRTPFPEGW